MKYEGPVKYSKPEDSYEEDDMKGHLFEVEENGEVISGAEVHYYSKPIPFYQVSSLYTDYDHISKGMASAVMDKVEAFLDARKKPGVLIDSISSDVPGVKGMYARRGWKQISSGGRYAYNLSEDIDTSIFENIFARGQDVGVAKSWEENRSSFLENS